MRRYVKQKLIHKKKIHKHTKFKFSTNLKDSFCVKDDDEMEKLQIFEKEKKLKL